METRRFEVAVEIEFGEDIDPVDAANLVAEALDFHDVDHDIVRVRPLDPADGSALAGWVTEDDEPVDGE